MSDLDEIRQRFESVNEAGSGLVGYEGLCKMYEGAEKSDIDELMTIIDLDGDGKVHIIKTFSPPYLRNFFSNSFLMRIF